MDSHGSMLGLKSNLIFFTRPCKMQVFLDKNFARQIAFSSRCTQECLWVEDSNIRIL